MGILDKIFPVDWFHLDPEYFPQDTRSLFTAADVLQYGILPLGKKHARAGEGKQILNVGFVNPGNKKARIFVQGFVSGNKEFRKYRAYRLKIEEFLLILQEIYELFPALFLQQPVSVCPDVVLYLEQLKKEKEQAELNKML